MNATPAGTTSFTATLPSELVERLDAEADARVLGRSLLIRLAVEDFLNRLVPLDAVTATNAIRVSVDGS